MKIVAAISLFHALRGVTYDNKREVLPKIIAIPGLNLNPFALNQLKNIRYLIASSRTLRRRRDLVIWHDAINNSTTKHKSNSRPCGIKNLCSYLTRHSFRFQAIVYCKREKAPDIFPQLLETGILVIQTTEHVISRRKQRSARCVERYYTKKLNWNYIPLT